MVKERLLIAGINGFLSGHVLDLIDISNKYDVFGIDKSGEFLYKDKHPIQKYIHCDITEYENVHNVLSEVVPDKIINLAGILKGDNFTDFYKINFLGSFNLLESIKNINTTYGKSIRIVLIGSAAEYGGSGGLSLNEESQLLPLTHYGLSKSLQSFVFRVYFLRDGMNVVLARPANITGPGQMGDFVIPVILEQVLQIKEGTRKPELVLGNIESKRDFIDVRDAARGIVLLLEKGTPGEIYNLSTDTCYSIHEIIDIIKTITKTDFEVLIDKTKLSKSDIPYISSSCNKIKTETGWSPSYSLKQTLIDMINEREKIY